jgi:hypothetical protein
MDTNFTTSREREINDIHLSCQGVGYSLLKTACMRVTVQRDAKGASDMNNEDKLKQLERQQLMLAFEHGYIAAHLDRGIDCYSNWNEYARKHWLKLYPEPPVKE